jgi:hypothetical protein
MHSTKNRSLTSTVGALTALGLVGISSPADAQDTVLNRHDQPVAGDTFLSVFGPMTNGHLVV